MFGIVSEEDFGGPIVVHGREYRAVRDSRIVASAGAILLLSISLLVLLGVMAFPAMGSTDNLTEHEIDLLINGYEEQVEILKWVGGIMVTALASAVGFLIRELLRSHRVLVNEVRVGAGEREKLSAVLRNVAQLLHDKPCLHEKYLEGLAEDREALQ